MTDNNDSTDVIRSGRTGEPVDEATAERVRRARVDADGTNDQLIPEEYR